MTVALALLVAAAPATAADQPDRLVLGPPTVEPRVTSYGIGCGGGTLMRYGRRVYFGAVASNTLRAKTLIRFSGPRIRGRRYFRIEDTGGPTVGLDIWSPSCSWAVNWGVRTRAYRTVRKRVPR